ncbi:hypothetical protein ACFVYD_16595 [Streptomyces sp. NPDC058301]|uniref:Uncharacterized protein n=1 Tax=Streptomyces sp. NBC_00060 TaxID=2975636 RepID=A0AAU2GW76_9ACTN
MTEPERTAAKAYVRLLQTAQAVLADPATAPRALALLAGPMAEAEESLRAAGLAGNEARLFALVEDLQTDTCASGP